LKAGSVIPNILKIRFPASATAQSTIPHVHAERHAIYRRTVWGEFTAIARNVGITARSANSRTCLTDAGICDERAQSYHVCSLKAWGKP
jgi:hypothetical protein